MTNRDPVKLAEYRTAYYERNKERIKARSAEWFAKNRDRANAERKQRYLANKEAGYKPPLMAYALQKKYSEAYKARHPKRYLLRSAKQRAKEQGLLFSLSEHDLVFPDVCPVFGTPLKIASKRGETPPENTASLDRIVPAAGYVPGNVRIISLLANMMKSTATPAQLQQFAVAVKAGVL